MCFYICVFEYTDTNSSLMLSLSRETYKDPRISVNNSINMVSTTRIVTYLLFHVKHHGMVSLNILVDHKIIRLLRNRILLEDISYLYTY